jgi:deoxyhypusine synthase
MSNQNDLMKKTIDIVLKPSNSDPTTSGGNQLDGLQVIKGYDLNNGLNFDDILASYRTIGFQATNFSKAVDEINRMVTLKIILFF